MLEQNHTLLQLKLNSIGNSFYHWQVISFNYELLKYFQRQKIVNVNNTFNFIK